MTSVCRSSRLNRQLGSAKPSYLSNETSLINSTEFIPPSAPTEDPCNPSPCGPNSVCRRFGNQASCSCLNGYFGVPPSCRPECVISSDCEQTKACMNEKCQNPCVGACGQNALCDVRNHNPICRCPDRYSGNPFAYCFPSREFELDLME